MWNYDSTSLILELKPLCTAFDRATCSCIHTQPYTTESVTDSVAKGGVAISLQIHCQLPKGPTPNLQIMTF